MKEKIEELLPFHALEVLSDSEEVETRSYIAETPEAQTELTELSRAVSALVYSPTPITPPPQLKQALMSRVQADSSVQPVSVTQPEAGFSQWWRNLGHQLTGNPLVPALAGLSVAIAILAGVWVNGQNKEITQLRQSLTAMNDKIIPLQEELLPLREENAALKQELESQRDQLAAQLEAMATVNNQVALLQEENQLLTNELATQSEQNERLASQLAAIGTEVAEIPDETILLTTLTKDLSAQEEKLIALNEEVAQLRRENAVLVRELLSQRTVMVHATSPDVQAMAIDGTEALPGAHGQLMANPANETAALIVSGLPPLQPGLVYKFWLVQGEQLQEAGVIDVDTEGLGILVVTSDTAIGSYDGMGVSIEPIAGSPQPSNEMIMVGNFSS